MNITASFKTVFMATFQIFLIGILGYCLMRKEKISENSLNFLSFLVIDVVLPLFIFTHLVSNFRFYNYSNWWIFPILSIIIIIFGFCLGYLFIHLNKKIAPKNEFLSLVSFQNCGYLPLILADFILQGETKEVMFIYIFLFIVGINLIMWSFGVSFLVSKRKGFEFSSLFTSPVVATLAAFLFLLLGLYKFIPAFVMRPLESLGNCALPLAMILVGGNLARGNFKGRLDKDVFDVVLIKLFLMPTIALLILQGLNLFNLIGLLIMLQVCMPSATSLSLIAGHYRLEDKLLSRGVFWTHIFGLFTIPLFLGLFFWMGMIQ